MESPRGPRVWYFFSDDLPDGELIVPIKTKYGLAFAVRRGAMGTAEQAMLDQLNATARFVRGVGLCPPHLEENTDEPPGGKE